MGILIAVLAFLVVALSIVALIYWDEARLNRKYADQQFKEKMDFALANANLQKVLADLQEECRQESADRLIKEDRRHRIASEASRKAAATRRMNKAIAKLEEEVEVA